MMKKSILLLILFPVLFSCTKDGDTVLPNSKRVMVYDNFDSLNPNKWTSLAQVGTKRWTLGSYSGDGYAVFNAYGSGQQNNVSWLIYNPVDKTDPQNIKYMPLDMDAQTGEVLTFQTAQAYLRSTGNYVEVFASSDFDGINFQNATWQKLPATIVNQDTKKFTYVNSGNVDLSKFTGKLYIAFKAVGGDNGAKDTATYQLDNFRISCDQ
jgi:hypothetical protein